MNDPLYNYSPGHSILTIFIISVQVLFAASQTGLDLQYNKLCIGYDSRVAERLSGQLYERN